MGSNNRMSINFDAALPSSVYDEETWLVQPPEEANGSSSSGHVVEWLQVSSVYGLIFNNIKLLVILA